MFSVVNDSTTPVGNITSKEDLSTVITNVTNLTSDENVLAKQLSEIKLLCISFAIALGICFLCFLVFSVVCCLQFEKFKRKIVAVSERRSLNKVGLSLII